MKLLAVRLARSIWLCPSYFVNPRGAFTRPLVEEIKKKYQFMKTPLDNPFPKPDEGYRYEQGVFNGVSILNLTFHADGAVVELRSSTDDGDAFLDDLMNFASSSFDLPKRDDLPIKRIYTSELNVIFENTPLFINPKLSKFLRALTATGRAAHNGEMDLSVLHFATESGLSDKPGIFKFEREINTTFAENRFYSFAQTKTDVHLELLEMLEELST